MLAHFLFQKPKNNTMIYPQTLTLLRHAESTENLRIHAAMNGEKSNCTKVPQPSFHYRLSERGIEQAKRTGEHLKENNYHFHIGFVSPFVRAIETAIHLDLPIKWFVDYRLCERSWGNGETVPSKDLLPAIEEAHRGLRENPICYRPGDGQSMLELFTQKQSFLTHLAQRDFAGKNVISVGHGESIHALRHILEGRTWGDFIRRFNSKHPNDSIPNAGFFHYHGKSDYDSPQFFTHLKRGFPENDGAYVSTDQEPIPHDVHDGFSPEDLKRFLV